MIREYVSLNCYRQVEPSCPAVIYNTLLELYLHDVAHESEITMRVERERQTLELLHAHIVRPHYVIKLCMIKCDSYCGVLNHYNEM